MINSIVKKYVLICKPKRYTIFCEITTENGAKHWEMKPKGKYDRDFVFLKKNLFNSFHTKTSRLKTNFLKDDDIPPVTYEFMQK
jgi:hypothetical protein